MSELARAVVTTIALVIAGLVVVVGLLSVVNLWRIDREDTSLERVEKTRQAAQQDSTE